MVIVSLPQLHEVLLTHVVYKGCDVQSNMITRASMRGNEVNVSWRFHFRNNNRRIVASKEIGGIQARHSKTSLSYWKEA